MWLARRKKRKPTQAIAKAKKSNTGTTKIRITMIVSISQGQSLEIHIEVTPSPITNPVVGYAVVLFHNKRNQTTGPLRSINVDLYSGPNTLLQQPYSILTIREVVDVYYECIEPNGITFLTLIFKPDDTKRRTIAKISKGLAKGDTFPLASRVKAIR